MPEELPPSGPMTAVCSGLLKFLSILLIILFFPFSLIKVIRVIPQYERAIIFRLGRIKGGKAVGPGVFYIIPCMDSVISVDTRLKTFDVPPQSASLNIICLTNLVIQSNPVFPDSVQGQCDGPCGCHSKLLHLQPSAGCQPGLQRQRSHPASVSDYPQEHPGLPQAGGDLGPEGDHPGLAAATTGRGHGPMGSEGGEGTHQRREDPQGPSEIHGC